MSKQILRIKEVQRRTGEGRSTIYEKLAEGKFPKPVKLGSKSVGWVSDEIDAYIDAKIAERDALARA